MNTLSHILKYKIISIIRGADPSEILQIVKALHAGGIKTLEITINSPKAIKVIEKVTDEYGDQLSIGAGTVLDAETARAALLAGAKFIVSPTIDKHTIRMTKKYGAISIPGAFSPTEILKAYSHGGDIIKVFPALLGPHYLKEIKGPLSQIPLMPTGGVNLENIKAFQEAGAAAFGLGNSLVDTTEEFSEEYLKRLTDKAKKYIMAIVTT